MSAGAIMDVILHAPPVWVWTAVFVVSLIALIWIMPDREPILLDDLELRMLRFIVGKMRVRAPVTTSTIYSHAPFLKESPHALYQSFLHLRDNGYIVAEEDPRNNPIAPPSAHRFTVQDVTEKGRKSLGWRRWAR